MLKTDAFVSREEVYAPSHRYRHRMPFPITQIDDSTQEEALEALILAQKSNPNLGAGAPMKVMMKRQDDGTVECVMPPGAPPDTVGYNRNRAFQKERAWKVTARLQQKLANRQTKTLVDYGRELEEKALMPNQ